MIKHHIDPFPMTSSDVSLPASTLPQWVKHFHSLLSRKMRCIGIACLLAIICFQSMRISVFSSVIIKNSYWETSMSSPSATKYADGVASEILDPMNPQQILEVEEAADAANTSAHMTTQVRWYTVTNSSSSAGTSNVVKNATKNEVRGNSVSSMLTENTKAQNASSSAEKEIIYSKPRIIEDDLQTRIKRLTPVIEGGLFFQDTYSGRFIATANESIVFWNNGQTKLCGILRSLTNVSKIGLDVPLHIRNQSTTAMHPTEPPLLNVTMPCKEMVKSEGLGQGNWVSALYMVRMASIVAKVDLQIQCDDGTDSQDALLLPWFEGYFPSFSFENEWPFRTDKPTEDEVCTDRYPMIRIDKVVELIQDDSRRMAMSIVSPRPRLENTNISTTTNYISTHEKPLFPDIRLDDVAIHFRCGDVLGGAKRNDFGMIKFNAYKRYIHAGAKTIGILTQPFRKDLARRKDGGHVEACRAVTMALTDYLQDAFPTAQISIRNGPSETLPLAYARLVMANQSFTSYSSFGIIPVIGTFGQGYFPSGNRGVNPFSYHVPQILPNIHIMEVDRLGTGQIRKVLEATDGLDTMLQWFSNDTFTIL